MEFKKYNSIENSYRKKEIENIKFNGFSVGDWVVQEKIHGAQFSFWCDGENVQCSKRTSMLSEGESFFNWNIVYDRYKDKILDLQKHIGNPIVIHGELFGGAYPHPDVEKKNIKCIQKGVYYSPDIDFYAFDLYEFLEPKKCIRDGVEQTVYPKNVYSVGWSNVLFIKFGLFYAKSLFVGTFDDCLNYTNLYNTNIPKWLGLPEIEDNVCEGNVLRPVEPKWFRSGSRVILKNKNDKWSEKSKASSKPNRESKEVVPLEKDVQDVIDVLLLYVTENRLRNVLSHIGEVTQKDFGKILGLFNRDALDDYMKENEGKYESLEKNKQKIITKKLNGKSSLMVRADFLNIIDGNF